MKISISKTFSMVVVAACIFAVSAGVANAQSGSRICGMVAVDTPVKIGLLYEARTKDASYKKQCKKVISKFKDAIKKDATLQKFKWKVVSRTKCENVGKMGFAYTKSPGNLKSDICEKMKAKKPYKVVKEGPKPTTFTRL
jgi:hypothetical protein